MKCPRCEQENPPQAKFCLECATPLALRCANCATELPAGARFCLECATPVTGFRPAPRSPRVYTPKHLADKILVFRSVMEGERKQVTVLFCDLVGSTRLAERLGPEQMHDLLNRFFDIALGHVHRYEGTINQFLGDGFMAIFGAPIAHEDHARRAVLAALALQRGLGGLSRELNLDFVVRIGMNSGLVVVGKIGDNLRMDYTAVGDTTNLAARLQSLADPGAVLLSDATLRLVQGLVVAEFVGTHQLKGKSEPQRAYRLDAIRQGATRFDTAVSRGLTAYVGRSFELETLERCVKEHHANVRIVDIVGDPGIGKSRLLHELRHRSDSSNTYLVGACSPDGRQTPFLPFIEVVRSSFRVAADESENQVMSALTEGLRALGVHSTQNVGLLSNLLSVAVPESSLSGLDGVLIGLRTRDLLLELLRAQSRVSRTILVLEDLHWIDSASEELLDRIVSLHEALPLLILHTRRPEYSPPWHAHPQTIPLRLNPLSDDDTSRIVHARLNADKLPHNLTRLIVERAEGNALFAEEIASFLSERGVVRRSAAGMQFDPSAVASAMPESVQSLLTSRVDQLSASDRSLLQLAAVIGRRFDPALLVAVAETDDHIDGRLAEMEAADLIHYEGHSGNFVFKHALVRDALYDSLLGNARKTLHLKVANHLERRAGTRPIEIADILAHHYSQTRVAEKAFTYLLMAGTKSLGVYSLDEAEQYFERALGLLPNKPELAGTVEFAELLSNMSQLLMMKLRPGKLKRLVDRHLPSIAILGDSPHVVGVLTNYAFAAAMTCQYRAMDDAARSALEIALRLNDARCKAYARGAVILAKALLGGLSLEEADEQAALAALDSERVNDPHLHNWVGFTTAWGYINRGLTDRGRACVEGLYARGQRTGDRRTLGLGLWLLSWLDIIDARFDDALIHGEDCIRTALAPMDKEIGVWAKGIAQIFLGQTTEGARLLIEGRERALANEWVYALSGIDGPLGVAMVLQGNFSDGIRFIEAAIKRNEQAGYNSGADLARLYAAETYIQLLGGKERPRLPFRVIVKNLPFLIVTSLTGWKRAVGLLKKAHENSMFKGVSHFRARIETDLGVLYLMKKRTSEAREYLHQARPIAAQLKAEALLARIDEALAKV